MNLPFERMGTLDTALIFQDGFESGEAREEPARGVGQGVKTQGTGHPHREGLSEPMAPIVSMGLS